jgi:hypothetical protein
MEPLSLTGDGAFGLEVVGESMCQDALKAICGGRIVDGHYKAVTATLVYEDSNPHDNLAVRVEIYGNKVGYLSRNHARSVQETTL